MKTWWLVFIFLFIPADQLRATDWCAKTVPPGLTVADQDLNCTGRTGVKVGSQSTFDLAGHSVTGAMGACIRAVNATNPVIKNARVSQCGAEGIDFSGVSNGRVFTSTLTNNGINGFRCANCMRLIIEDTVSSSNASAGIKIEGGTTNQVVRATTQWNQYGVRLTGAAYVKIYDGVQWNNAVNDVEFSQGTTDSQAWRGTRGRVRFLTNARNNWAADYHVSCDGDGTGAGTNQCR